MSLMRLSGLFDVIKSRFSGICDRKTAFSCHKPSKKPVLLHQINIIPSRITSGVAILLLLNRKMPRIIFCARGISAVGAHHTGSVGVTGSSPVCSTKSPLLIKQRASYCLITCFSSLYDIDLAALHGLKSRFM